MRIDPRFHFFVAPVLLLNIVVAVVVAIRYWAVLRWLGVWMTLVALAIFVTAGLVREYCLRNQDRIIRLEERLRYANLLSPAELALAEALSLRQRVALRFASDAELPALTTRAAQENLSAKVIKQAIVSWRADHHRV